MKELALKIRLTPNNGIIHDSRHDVRTIAQLLNIVIDEHNEVVRELNKCQEEIKQLKENK